MATGLHKAERKRSKLRGWMSGTSSSGKTYTALTLFKGFGGKTALIDTESGRGEMYGGTFEYDVLSLSKPFTPERYVEAIREVEAAGYQNLIIDSISHAWMEILEIKGKLDERGGNSFTNWNVPGRRYAALMEHVNQSPLHVISTARAKRKHVMETDDKGKTVIRRLGVEDVAREGAEYDMTLELRLNADHTAEALKDNTGLFLGQDPRILTVEDGAAVRRWLEGGKAPDCANCTLKGKVAESSEEIQGKPLCAECVKRWREIEKNAKKS